MSCAYFKSIHQQTIDIIFNIRPLIMQLLNIFLHKKYIWGNVKHSQKKYISNLVGSLNMLI